VNESETEHIPLGTMLWKATVLVMLHLLAGFGIASFCYGVVSRLSVSPGTGRGGKVASFAGRMRPREPRRRRSDGREAKAVCGGVQGPGGSCGVARGQDAGGVGRAVRRACELDRRGDTSGAGGDAGRVGPQEAGGR